MRVHILLDSVGWASTDPQLGTAHSVRITVYQIFSFCTEIEIFTDPLYPTFMWLHLKYMPRQADHVTFWMNRFKVNDSMSVHVDGDSLSGSGQTLIIGLSPDDEYDGGILSCQKIQPEHVGERDRNSLHLARDSCKQLEEVLKTCRSVHEEPLIGHHRFDATFRCCVPSDQE